MIVLNSAPFVSTQRKHNGNGWGNAINYASFVGWKQQQGTRLLLVGLISVLDMSQISKALQFSLPASVSIGLLCYPCWPQWWIGRMGTVESTGISIPAESAHTLPCTSLKDIQQTLCGKFCDWNIGEMALPMSCLFHWLLFTHPKRVLHSHWLQQLDVGKRHSLLFYILSWIFFCRGLTF